MLGLSALAKRFMQHAFSTSLRPMVADDLDAVLAVQAACYPPSMQEAAHIVAARIACAARSCLVAFDAGGVCAYLFAYPSRLGAVTPLDAPFAVALEADTLYLHDLAVAPRALGQGLARRLVGALLDQARAMDLGAAGLVSVQDTAGFWGGLGFVEMELACPLARAALASYPGPACYMRRQLA